VRLNVQKKVRRNYFEFIRREATVHIIKTQKMSLDKYHSVKKNTTPISIQSTDEEMPLSNFNSQLASNPYC